MQTFEILTKHVILSVRGTSVIIITTYSCIIIFKQSTRVARSVHGNFTEQSTGFPESSVKRTMAFVTGIHDNR